MRAGPKGFSQVLQRIFATGARDVFEGENRTGADLRHGSAGYDPGRFSSSEPRGEIRFGRGDHPAYHPIIRGDARAAGGRRAVFVFFCLNTEAWGPLGDRSKKLTPRGFARRRRCCELRRGVDPRGAFVEWLAREPFAARGAAQVGNRRRVLPSCARYVLGLRAPASDPVRTRGAIRRGEARAD